MAEEVNEYFFALVFSLKQACYIHLGKLRNPAMDKTEIDLPNAKVQIDILDMLKSRMKGNLTKEEEMFLADTLAELQLNYLETLKMDQKSEVSDKTSGPEKKKDEPTAPGSENSGAKPA
ncbi:MAG TPA: DUF1844 domain-containing protein [bacterium]|nr:DUF1844 domain-containing protein [bacterium]